METYLSNAMWGTLEQYPENYNNLGKGINNSAKLSTIFSEGIQNFIKEALKNFQYHNLAQVKIHYKNAFDVNFQANLTDLFHAVNIRHDIVHRCGISKKNISRTINFEDINILKANINSFIKDIDNQLCINFKD
jgi:citrate lyase gamma subunit